MADGSLFEDWGADISEDGVYRYLLWRIWDSSRPLLLFIMLNPSTADARSNDATIERCSRRAREMGFGGLLVVNIFAFRSTYPSELYRASDPIGPRNEAAILSAAARAGFIICGWGEDGALAGRGAAVLQLLRQHGYQPHALKINKDGSPRHPLYVSYATKPVPISA
jgi:hypothetical protein